MSTILSCLSSYLAVERLLLLHYIRHWHLSSWGYLKATIKMCCMNKVNDWVQLVHRETVYDCLNRDTGSFRYCLWCPWMHHRKTDDGVKLLCYNWRSDWQYGEVDHLASCSKPTFNRTVCKNSLVKKDNLECKSRGTWWGMRPSGLFFFPVQGKRYTQMYSRRGEQMDGQMAVGKIQKWFLYQFN